jgi:hypothetical protein
LGIAGGARTAVLRGRSKQTGYNYNLPSPWSGSYGLGMDASDRRADIRDFLVTRRTGAATFIRNGCQRLYGASRVACR